MKTGWHSRGYLPHFDVPGLIQFVTFSLHDSVPRSVIERWKEQLEWTERLAPDDPINFELRSRIDKYEDKGYGECWLRRPEIAALVENAFLFFDGERYRLLAWCVMPNHVHACLKLIEPHTLSQIVQSIKSFTAKAANNLLGRTGKFWQRDYFDRFVRDASHYGKVIAYIENNPVKAGLVREPADWKWSSAYWKKRDSEE